jgi:hypothetical protein
MIYNADDPIMRQMTHVTTRKGALRKASRRVCSSPDTSSIAMAEVVKVYDTLPMAPVAAAVAAIPRGPWQKCVPCLLSHRAS